MYSIVQTPLPTIAYCAFHQPNRSVPADEYVKTMVELHQRIAQESIELNAARTKFLSEAVTRESQGVQNALAQFLHTPISSDKEEVQRTLRESFERLKDQLLDGSSVGLSESVESRVFFVSSKKSLEKKLLRNGKLYLEKLGFATVKGSAEIFESTFIVNGGMNLDILEHIVRDRLGIYSTTHGKHIKEFEGYAYAAYNLAFVKGKMPAPDTVADYTELAFYFSKPDVKYAPFRSGLSEALEKLADGLALDYVSLWQRKLGLGVGKEFVLRVVGNRPEAAAEVIHWLDEYEEKPFVREAIIGNGNLLVKELLFR